MDNHNRRPVLEHPERAENMEDVIAENMHQQPINMPPPPHDRLRNRRGAIQDERAEMVAIREEMDREIFQVRALAQREEAEALFYDHLHQMARAHFERMNLIERYNQLIFDIRALENRIIRLERRAAQRAGERERERMRRRGRRRLNRDGRPVAVLKRKVQNVGEPNAKT